MYVYCGTVEIAVVNNKCYKVILGEKRKKAEQFTFRTFSEKANLIAEKVKIQTGTSSSWIM
jgi:hypothetical protein